MYKENCKGEGIFLLFEGLLPTVIESQVIAHVKSMSDMGFDIDVWSFAIKPKTFNNALKELNHFESYGVPIKIFRGILPGFPFSDIINAMLLFYWLKKYKKHPDFIHARTEYSASVASFVKFFINFKLIWDSRGDTESEFLLQMKQSGIFIKIAGRFWLWSIRFRIRWLSKQADSAIFVSKTLKQLHCRHNSHFDIEVIPNGANPEYFFFSPELRLATRNDLKIAASDKVLVYSGSLAPWQGFSETIELFRNLIQMDRSYRLLIITPEIKAVQSYIQTDIAQYVICVSARLMEVNAYLNAADFAVLLKKQGTISYVASPVKFAEYCLTGLFIIMNNSVQQCVELSQLLGNGIYSDYGKPLNMPDVMTDEQRSILAQNAIQILSRKIIEKKYIRLYSANTMRYKK